MSRLPPARRGAHPLVAVVATCLLLGGCASTGGLAPQGRLHDADELQVSRSLGNLSVAAFPQQDWWTTFGDRQLDALITEALAGTPSLDAADARERQALAQAALTDSARSPSLSAGAQYSGLRIPETVAPAPLGGEYKGIVLLDLNFKYAFDLWGGAREKWQAALGQARAAQVDAQAARLMLSSDIARTYVTLAQAFATQQVARDDKARASHLLDLGRQRVKAGIDNQLQLRQAESSVASAQQQAQAAQQQIDALRNALAALLGKGPDRGLAIDKPVLLATPSPGVPSLLPSELLGHRPDVVAARWRVEAARHGINASKAAFYPSVNLSALAGLASGGLSDLLSTDALLVQGGPAISLPIFNGGGLRNQLSKSDADYDLAVASYNQTLVVALREVTDALQAARSLDAQIASATQARDAAQAAWKIASLRYHAGLGTQLDVLAAQKPLLQFDQQLAALRAQRLTAAIDMDRALGGGLVPVAPVAASNTPSSDIAKVPTP